MIKKILFLVLFFTGWILSPFTWWNDAFVNLPLSYIISNLIIKSNKQAFLPVFLFSYLLTNILGLFLIFFSADRISENRPLRYKLRTLLITVAVYSIISAFLIHFRIIGPF